MTLQHPSTVNGSQTVYWPYELTPIIPVTLEQTFKQGVQECIFGNDRLLYNAVASFRKVFPALSLWERLKDVFGLSETADNQRDMATLCILSMFEQYNSLTDTTVYAQLAGVLYKALDRKGLCRAPEYAGLQAQAAYAVAGLLTRNPKCAEQIVLSNPELCALNNGFIQLKGYISFKEGAEKPAWPEGQPFMAVVRSSCRNDIEFLDALDSEMSSASVFTTLFDHMSPSNKLLVQKQATKGAKQLQELTLAGGLLDLPGRVIEGDELEFVDEVANPANSAISIKTRKSTLSLR